MAELEAKPLQSMECVHVGNRKTKLPFLAHTRHSVNTCQVENQERAITGVKSKRKIKADYITNRER